MIPEIEILTSLVGRVLNVEDVTLGDPRKNYIARYGGKLYGDSEAAYDQLTEALRPYDVTVLFRIEDGRHIVLILDGIIRPQPSNPVVNVVMLVLTIVSVLVTGAWNAHPDVIKTFPELLRVAVFEIHRGLPYGLSLMAILLAHEFGHYLMGRRHGAGVTLPYFIPLPIPGGFGTLGAIIRMKTIPKNRRQLLDIGIAGPLAGLIVAVPVLLIGLSLSKVEPLPLRSEMTPQQGFMLEGNSIFYLGMKLIAKGELLPAPLSYGSTPPVIYWVRYLFTGFPIPFGGRDVQLHPIAWAGWAGLLVTALNLIPVGQLDGGHLLYVLRGRKAMRVMPFVLIALILLGFVWTGWWLWAFLVMLFGRIYIEPLDLITPLDARRKRLAILGLVIFILIFMPVPLTLVAG